MISHLFGKQTVIDNPKPTKVKKPKTKKKKGPEPQKAEQECAPYEHIQEASPEPADVIDTLEYDLLQEDEFDEWDAESIVDSDVESNYDVSSMSRHDDDQPETLFGSVQSSPGFMSGLKSSVTVEKKRPPGITVSFDDDSWIE